MFEIVKNMFPILLCLFQGYCMQYFYGSFLESRLKDERRTRLGAAVLYALLRTALIWTGPSDMWDYRAAVWKLLLTLGMVSVLAVCFYKAFHLLTVFLAVSFQAVSDISRYTAVILIGELGDSLLKLCSRCAESGMFTSVKAYDTAVQVCLTAEWILEYLLIALLLYLPLKKIVGDFREKEYSMNRRELLFILTPAAVGLLLCLLLRVIVITMEDGVPRILYDRYPVLIAVLPAILLLSLLSIVQGVRLFQDMISRNRERSGRIILEKQVRSLQEHMEEMERINLSLRSVKHDMRNTISVIQRLAVRNGEEENRELQAYLSELNRTFESLEVCFKTGNTVVDTLLNMKYHEAVREVPELRIDADYLLLPQELEIRSYDIGVILGNALDNAIEACRKLKEREAGAGVFIRLCSLQKGKLLILKVENSFDGHLASYGYNVAEYQAGKSYLFDLDENGDIRNCTVTGGGGKLIGPTKEEREQFEAEQARKRKLRIKYIQIQEESAERRWMEEQENLHFLQSRLMKQKYIRNRF